MDDRSLVITPEGAQWESLKDALRRECHKVSGSSPTQLVMEEEGIYEATLSNLRKGTCVQLRYDPTIPCINVRVGEKTGRLSFRLSIDKTLAQIMEGSIPRDVGTISVNLLRRIF